MWEWSLSILMGWLFLGLRNEFISFLNASLPWGQWIAFLFCEELVHMLRFINNFIEIAIGNSIFIILLFLSDFLTLFYRLHLIGGRLSPWRRQLKTELRKVINKLSVHFYPISSWVLHTMNFIVKLHSM